LVGDATRLTVLEGEVSSQSVATNQTQLVAAGQTVQSGTGGAGAIAAIVKPQDAVQWVLRYPPISDRAEAAELPTAEDCASRTEVAQPACLAARAEGLLRSGSVDDALAAIDSAPAAIASTSDFQALRSIVQVAKNDKTSALDSARDAARIDGNNYRAWIALSYAQEASFDLEAALESARKAEALRPASSLAHARVAELLLSLGDISAAEDAARAAVASNPEESEAHTVLGFVHLAKYDATAAQLEFSAAIERDSFSALPRLGLGLAMIRAGELKPGREQVERATRWPPINSSSPSSSTRATRPRISIARFSSSARHGRRRHSPTSRSRHA
jgi:tetratricopeptide (TPR) repeat protein